MISMSKIDRLKQRLAEKLIKDSEIRELRQQIGPDHNFPDDGMKRSLKDSEQNFRIQTRGIARERLDKLTKKTRRDNPETPLINKVPFGPEYRKKKGWKGESLTDSDQREQHINLDYTDENNPISRPPKTKRSDWTRIIQAKQLKQRIAQVRLAYAGPPVDVINAFRNKKALKMHAKNKKGKELSFQTDGETLFQSGYPIAKHTEKGISFSYQGHPSATTAQAGRMLGINTFHTKGKYYVNGNEVDPTQYDYTEVPFKDIQEGTVKVNKNIKTVPMTPEKRQLMKDQDFFSTKARRELKDPETGEIYDQVVVQPEDQREINRVTGLDTPIPEKTIATEIHHSIPKSKVQALRRSTTGAVALSPKSHQEAHFPERFVKRNLRKARLKIARMKQRNISRGMPRIAMGALARNVMQKARDNPLFKRGDPPTGYVYDEDKNIFLNAEKRADALAIRKKHGKSGQWLGINSVTDTDFGKKPVLRNEEGLRQIERELNDIEDIQKDRPILGGYEESIEASYPVIGDEKTILSRLNKNQESSLGIDPQGTAFLLYPDGKRTQITKD